MKKLFLVLKFFINNVLLIGQNNHFFSFCLKRLILLSFVFLAQILINPFHSFVCLDFITPLLVYFIIVDSAILSLCLSFYVALLLEGYGFFPLGFYFCTYTCIWLVMTVAINYICWQNLYAWFCVILFSQVWLMCMEFFLTITKVDISFEAISYFIYSGFSRFLVSILIFAFFVFRELLSVPSMRS